MEHSFFPHSPLDITEGLQTIAILLDPADLVAASLVSRHWYRCCSPILWKTVASSDWCLARFSPRQLYAHACLVRSLEWRSMQTAASHQRFYYNSGMMTMMGMTIPPPQLQPPYAEFKNNTDYTPEGRSEEGASKDSEPEVPVRDQLSLMCLNKIVGQCSALQKLSLHAERDGIHVGIIQAIRPLVYLQSLELYAHRVVVDEESMKSATRQLNVQDLVRGLPQLKRLTLRGSAFSFQPHLTEAREGQESSDCQVETAAQAKTSLAVAIEVERSYAAVSRGELAASQLNYRSSVTPHLASLFHVPCEHHDCYPQTTQTSLLPPKSTFPIQHLSLDTPVSEIELTILLQQCPLLASLDLPGGLAWEISDSFIQHCASSCPHLSAFSINSSSNAPVPEDRLSALVLALPPLRRFGARSCLFGDATLTALDQQSPDLEVLDISLTRGYQLSKPRLYEFLQHARGLKRLEADGVWVLLQDLQDSSNTGIESTQSSNNEALQDQDQDQDQLFEQQQDNQGQQGLQGSAGVHDQPIVISTPATVTTVSAQSPRTRCASWASRDTLAYLTIGFTTPDRSTRQCYAMYTLLSTLTQLKHLQLSYTCLSLSPDSGFYQLGRLKQLRTFSIETCGYNPLTQEDLTWMVAAWPRLERIVLNMPGAAKERHFRTWLKEANREDVAIESQRSMLY